MTSIMRWAAIAATALLSAASAHAAEKRFGLTSFAAIEVGADVDVEVVTRAPVSAVATGPQDALDRLSVENRDGRLVIGMRQFAGDDRRGSSPGAVLLRINAATLQSATLVGAGSLHIDGMKGQRVALGLRGPGKLSVDAVDTDRLAVAMIGNGTLTLAGKAKQAQMTLSGSGVVDAGKLAVDGLISDSEGTGDHIFNAVKSAAITARGSGKTVVLGRPVCTVRNVGTGTVACGRAR